MAASPSTHDDPIVGLLEGEIVEASKVQGLDFGGTSDPYCIAHLGLKTFHTPVIKSTVNPKWNFTFRTLIPLSERNYNLEIKVWDKDNASKDDFLGFVTVDLSSFFDDQLHEVVVPLQPEPEKAPPGKDLGTLHVRITIHTKGPVERRFWASIIEYFDKDGNRTLERLELEALIESIGSSASNGEVEELFRLFDTNQDGKISFDEFYNLVTDNASRSQPLVQKLLPLDPNFVWKVALHEEGGTSPAEVVISQWSSVVGGETLSTKEGKPAQIKVHDRASGKLVDEKIPNYIKVAMRVMYSTMRVAVDMAPVKKILKSLTAKQGKKYNDPKSVKDIRPFIEFHNLSEPEMLDPVDSFKNFNEFFYRKLKASARPIADPSNPRKLVSAADSRLNVFNTIDEATRIWVKGTHFSLKTLVHGDEHIASLFNGGSMVIFRLAPQDYHRFHSPVSGKLGTIYEREGTYYTVNPVAVNQTLDVYTENVRRWLVIDSPEFGPVLFVAVGATMVGSINFTAREGQVVNKGDELGYFAFGGSTNLVFFQPGRVKFDDDLVVNSLKPIETLVKMGESLGDATH